MDEQHSSRMLRSSPLASSSLAPHRSIYEAIKEHEQAASHRDDGDSSAIDERNLSEPFHDQDLDRLLAEESEESQTLRAEPPQPAATTATSMADPYPQPMNLPPTPSETESDTGIPTALLAEDKEHPHRARPAKAHFLPSPVPGPRDNGAAFRSRQSNNTARHRAGELRIDQHDHARSIADPAQKALWMWANVDNLDVFLADVYAYFRGKGIWSILLARLFEQLTLAFVVGFGTFLTACVDYSALPNSTRLSDIVLPRCTQNMSGFANLVLWAITFYWIFKSLRLLLSARRLWDMHCFYTHLLKVSEDELQTITWQTIVSRLMDLRDSNARTALNVTQRNRKFLGDVSKQRMDAHDIANRLMRKDNYLIALFNKDILDLTLPVPFLRDRPLFSQNLEWNINLCVIDYVFNDRGEVSQLFLKDSHRHELIEGLRRRFFIAGCINVFSAPFIVTYFLLLYFLRYFTEFQNHPARIGSRSYSPLAEWKFREFNELYHFFERRLTMSRPFASQYLDQFPKDKMTQLARFVAFVAGALAAVLAIATLLDPELFLGFEITHDRTALFYLSLFGSVWAVARGMVPEEERVFDPERAINSVAEFTHYKPDHWDGRLHTEDVRREFSSFYQMKIVIFLEEILSIVFTPFLLWFTLPNCSERLVDFFREFTVHVDGLGYVCSFALFEFSKGAPRLPGDEAAQHSGQQDRLREEYFSTKDGKMLSSYYSFMDSYANNDGRTGPSTHPAQRGRPAPRAWKDQASRSQIQGPRDAQPLSHSSRQRRPARPATATAVTSSPSPSILLDARHQPAKTPMPRSDPRQTQALHSSDWHSQPRPDANQERADEPPMSSSALIEEDSNLGDSWRTTMAAGSGDPVREQEQPAPANDAGVLGLLYEFQRAQTEGRGTGVKM